MSWWKQTWLWALVGALFLALFFWFAGPLFAIGSVRPLASIWARALLTLLLIGGWAGWYVWRQRRLRKANADLVAALAEDAAANATQEETQELGGKLSAALERLKALKLEGGQSTLYQLPWYAIIGPPGAGKTTALLNSGLSFPLADGETVQALKGVGGTRNCDWWFTDQAVLIDTAGRYTTQDSNRERDAGVWLNFLRLLKRHRPLQPLNGILIAVPAPDLLGGEDERAQLGQSLRARLAELQKELGVRLPVYIVLTKLDLLQGFDAFFEGMSRDERNQVWGVTLPLEASRKPETAGAALKQGFAALLARLADQTVARMHTDNDVKRRGLIFGFPQQVNLLAAPLATLLATLTDGARLTDAPLVRGVYLTSATQQGRPIERVLAGLSTQLGLSPPPATRAGQGRSYFLKDLLSEVVFKESALAGYDPRADRRQRLLYLAGAGAGVAAALTLIAIWTGAFIGQSRVLDRYAETLARYRASAGDLAGQDVRPYSPVVVEALGALAGLPFQTPQSSPGGLALGLAQDDRVGEPTRAIVRRELNEWLLPGMILRLEDDIRTRLNDPESLYRSLRTYLMLGGRGPLDAPGALAWLDDDMAANPGALNGEQQSLLRQSQALQVSGRLDPPTLDGRLIDQARTQLERITPAQRTFALIRFSAKAEELAPWRAANFLGPLEPDRIALVFGPDAQQVEVPGFFTKDGYFSVFLPALADSKALLLEQFWVMGLDPRSPETTQSIRRARAEAAQLYASNFKAVWSQALARLSIQPARSPGQAEQQMRIAADPGSPVRAVLEAAAKATDLQVPGGAKKGPLGNAVNAMQKLEPDMAAIDRSRAQLEAEYARLRSFVTGAAGQPSQLDAALQQFAAVADKLAEAGGAAAAAGDQSAVATSGAAVAGAKAAVAVAEQKAAAYPAPMDAWGQMLAQNSGLSVNASSRRQLQGVFTGAGVGDLCSTNIKDHFPLSPTGGDIPLAAFADYFRPGGVLADFFDRSMRPYVDTSAAVWRLTDEGRKVGLKPEAVPAFQRGDAVRRAYFAEGSLEPKVFFRVGLAAGDPSAAKIVFTLGDQTISFDASAAGASRSFVWPDPFRSPGARVEFFGQDGASLGETRFEGDWALFRLLKAGKVQAQGKSDALVTVQAGTRRAVFKLSMTQTQNPIVADPLASFRCPEVRP